MKYYGIYQFYVDQHPFTGSDRKRRLLVGCVEAPTEDLAKDVYLEDAHPKDEQKRDFIRRYLSVQETTKENINKPEVLKAIENNKKELRNWA